jgi:hypothetical protein
MGRAPHLALHGGPVSLQSRQLFVDTGVLRLQCCKLLTDRSQQAHDRRTLHDAIKPAPAACSDLGFARPGVQHDHHVVGVGDVEAVDVSTLSTRGLVRRP